MLSDSRELVLLLDTALGVRALSMLGFRGIRVTTELRLDEYVGIL